MALSFRKSMLAKNRPGSRITAADAFLNDLVKMLGLSQVAARLKKSEAEIRGAVKAARSKRHYLYTETNNDKPLVAYRPEAAKSKLVAGKKDAVQEPMTMTPGASMDFAAVLTTKNEDRDSDVLYPEGALIDPAMPLLFQHLPFENCGKFVKVLSNDGTQIVFQAATHTTALGNDVAIMLEFGSLRISHGFVPIDFDVRRDDNGKELAGWEVKRFHVFEASAVSIPANTEAVILGTSRDKFASPIVKGWGQYLYDNRNRLYTDHALKSAGRSGRGGINVNVSLKGLAELFKATNGRKDDNPATDDDDPNKKPKEGDAANDDTDPNKKPKGDEGDGSTTDNNQSNNNATPFPEVVAAVAAMLKDEMPQEALDRITTAGNLLTGLGDAMQASATAVGAAAGAGDIAGMIAENANIIDKISTTLNGVCDELTRAATVAEISEQVAAKITAAAENCIMLRDAVNALTGESEIEETPNAANPEPSPEPNQTNDLDTGNDGDDLGGKGKGVKSHLSPAARLYSNVAAGTVTLSDDDRALLANLVDDEDD